MRRENGMKMKIISMMLLGFLVLSSVSIFSVHALPANSMWIAPSPDPLSFFTNTTSIGFTFNVTIMFNVTTPTNSWQFYLIYNKAQLNAVRCDYTGDGKSQWAGSKSVNTVTPAFGNHNATYGYVVHGEVLKSSVEVTGVGSLSWVEFQIMQAPGEGQTLTSDLMLGISGAFVSRAMDKTYNSIPLTFYKASYVFASEIPPPTPPPPATIYVDPAKTVNPSLVPGSIFAVDVKIKNATRVYSFDFKLGFDKNVLNALNATIGGFFPPSTVPVVAVNNAAGYVEVSATLTSPPSVNGSGGLAIVFFTVGSFGPSPLHLYDNQTKDENAIPLPSNTTDGYFNNVLLAKLYVDPPEIIDPTLLPPKTFEVNVTLDDVENLYGYEFNMSYNKDVLTCLYVIVNDVLGETHYLPETQISNSRGCVWVKVTYYPPAVPITTYNPVALATIHFRVKSAGVSVLHLHDTSLTNSTGDPIPYEVTDGFVMTVIHDVAITGVTPLSSWAYAGWPVQITVFAKNLGNVSETFDVTTYYDGTLIGTIPVASLPPNTEIALNFTWDTTGVPGGIYTISGNASIVPYEFNTTNNVYVDGQVNILEAKRDVGITSVVPDGTWAYQGWQFNITVTAENLGDTNETYNVTLLYDANIIGTVTLNNVSAHTAVSLLFIWNTTAVAPCHNYTIRAEASLVPYEYNVTNNVYVDGEVDVRIVGDVNGDGKVDITDVAIVSGAFGSYPGHPRWNPACDLNRDGRVDITDVATVSANYGQTCPP
jgi:hypothetical protein